MPYDTATPDPGGPAPDASDEPAGEPELSRRQERVLELVATIILAAGTLVMRGAGHQATRWDGVQASDYVQVLQAFASSRRRTCHRRGPGPPLRFAGVPASGSMPMPPGDTALAMIYERRFRDEFVPAWKAWMATDPLHNANAPKGPLYMAEYVVADSLTADRLEAKAATTIQRAAGGRQPRPATSSA